MHQTGRAMAVQLALRCDSASEASSIVAATDGNIPRRDGDCNLTCLRHSPETNHDASRFFQRYCCRAHFFRPSNPMLTRRLKATGKMRKQHSGIKGIQQISRGGAVWHGLAYRRTGICCQNRLISWMSSEVKVIWSQLNSPGLLCRDVNICVWD